MAVYNCNYAPTNGDESINPDMVVIYGCKPLVEGFVSYDDCESGQGMTDGGGS